MLLIIWLEDRISDDTQWQWTVVMVMVFIIEGMYVRRQFFTILEISAYACLYVILLHASRVCLMCICRCFESGLFAAWQAIRAACM